MPDAPSQTPRAPRQPKIRASCDRCGASKLKCDRVRPQCGRCIPLGLDCVYGVSRKMGKPARVRLRIPELPVNHCRPEGYTGIRISDRPDDEICNSGATGSVSDGMLINSGPFHSVNSVPSAWGVDHSDNKNLMTTIDGSDVVQNDPSRSSVSSFASLDFYRDLLDPNLQTGPLSTLGSPNFEGYPSSAAEITASQPHTDENVLFDSASIPSARSGDHDCSREANDILCSLSLLHLNKKSGLPGSASSYASTTASITNRVPFDHILRLNRESSERLGRLLACHCARWPHQALLYASIISLVLSWYEEAADYTHKASYTPVDTAADIASSRESQSGCQSPWSTTVVDTLNLEGLRIPTETQAMALAVAPTHMALGSFKIDDEQVQCALRIQVLLGEVKRTGSLIDLYRSSSGVNESTFGSVDGLYTSLSSWLRKEHSRIADDMRSRLMEAST